MYFGLPNWALPGRVLTELPKGPGGVARPGGFPQPPPP